MFMSPGNYEEEDRLFAAQEYLQLFLLIAALIAVSNTYGICRMLWHARHGEDVYTYTGADAPSAEAASRVP